MERKIGTNYTTIMHGPRIQLGLTCNEYCVADMIYHLSRDTGWCYASKEKLSDFIGMTKQSIIDIVRRLINKGLVEMHEEDRRLLRTTSQWQQAVVIFKEGLRGKETVRTVRGNQDAHKDSRPMGGQNTAPYNYSSQSNTEKSGFPVPEKPLSLLRQKNIEIAPGEIKYPDKETLAILEQFSDEYIKQEWGMSRPIMKADAYYAVLSAKRHLTLGQMRELVADWLNLSGNTKPENAPHITRAFSSKHITSWKHEQGL